MQGIPQTFCVDVGTLRLCKVSRVVRYILRMKFLVDWISQQVRDCWDMESDVLCTVKDLVYIYSRYFVKI